MSSVEERTSHATEDDGIEHRIDLELVELGMSGLCRFPLPSHDAKLGDVHEVDREKDSITRGGRDISAARNATFNSRVDRRRSRTNTASSVSHSA